MPDHGGEELIRFLAFGLSRCGPGVQGLVRGEAAEDFVQDERSFHVMLFAAVREQFQGEGRFGAGVGFDDAAFIQEIQGLVLAREWEFESPLRHHK